LGEHPIENFLCLGRSCSDKELALRAVAVYAMFRATIFYRGLEAPDASVVGDALENWCKTAVSKHYPSSKFLKEAWKKDS